MVSFRCVKVHVYFVVTKVMIEVVCCAIVYYVVPSVGRVVCVYDVGVVWFAGVGYVCMCGCLGVR